MHAAFSIVHCGGDHSLKLSFGALPSDVFQGVDLKTEHQMDKKMGDEMEAGVMLGFIYGNGWDWGNRNPQIRTP